jgi:phospholipid/cholesterol/gamma-HCH transport system substrate-binding protein
MAAMKRTDRVKWGELKVGLLVAFGLAFLLWASFSGSGTSIFYSKRPLNTLLNTANGLIAGAPVRLSGVEVGKVGEIRLIGKSPSEQVFVTMLIEERAWPIVKADSRATLGTIGMLGDKYIEVSPGSLELPELKPGDYIEGRVAGDLLGLIDRAPEMVGNLEHLARALGDLARKLEGTEGTLGKLIHSDTLYESLTRASRQAASLVARLDERVPTLVDKAGTAVDEFTDVARSVTDTAGTVGKLLTSASVYDRLNTLTLRLDSLAAGLQAGQGTAGALLKDETVYADLHKTILDVQFLLKDIQENPKKYVTFKVF